MFCKLSTSHDVCSLYDWRLLRTLCEYAASHRFIPAMHELQPPAANHPVDRSLHDTHSVRISGVLQHRVWLYIEPYRLSSATPACIRIMTILRGRV